MSTRNVITEKTKDEYHENVDDEFSRYFRSLGYGVTWDFKDQNKWYEIMDGERMFCQIDFGIPLAHVLEDLPLLADGKSGTSPSDYTVWIVDDVDLKTLCQKIEAKR